MRARRERPIFAALTLSILIGSCTSEPVAVDRAAKDAISQATPPEGALLIFSGNANGAVVLSSQGDRVELVDAAPLALDHTAERVLTSREVRVGFISYNPSLAITELGSGIRRILARAPPKVEFGIAQWSPDGVRIAYQRVRYRRDPAEGHPGISPKLTACVLVLSPRRSTCYPRTDPVFDMTWAPDGQSLTISGRSGALLRLQLPSGRISPLVSSDDPHLARALRGRRLNGPVHFFGPRWAASGRFLAAWVDTPEGRVPAIFSSSGRLVKLGRSSLGNGDVLRWSPADDILFYTRGFTIPSDPDGWIWALRSIDPSIGGEHVVMRRQGRPITTDFLLSPSGDWVALLRADSDSEAMIEFVDLRDATRRRTIYLDDDVSLVGWEG